MWKYFQASVVLILVFLTPTLTALFHLYSFTYKYRDKRKESGVNLNSAELLVLRNAAFHSACYFRQLFGTLGSNYLFLIHGFIKTAVSNTMLTKFQE